MPQVEPLKRLEIDGRPHLVEDMSTEIQQLVAVYNEWNQDAVDARKKASQLQASVDMVKEQMSQQIRKEQAAAAEAEAAEDTSAVVSEGHIDTDDESVDR